METQVNEICDKEFRNIHKRLDQHEKRFDDMDEDLDNTKGQVALMSGDIKSLVKSLDGLTDTLKLIGGPILLGIIGFFFYALQNSLIK